MLGQENAQNLCSQVLQLCGQDQVEVLLTSADNSLTRFANNAIHQNVAERNAYLEVRVVLGKRSGMAATNRMDPDGLARVVEQARANAQASPEDPDYPGLAEPGKYTRVNSFDPAAADFSAKERARAAGAVCRLAAEKNLNASGAFTTGTNEVAVANTNGLFAYHAGTHTDFQTVVMAEDASGRAQTCGWRAADIDGEALGREAIHKAEAGRNPRQVEAGEYTVIFDPYVTQDLLTMLDFHGMGAQMVQEGRSWMNDRMGQKRMDGRVSIWDDGLDLEGKPQPFDFEGVPKQRVEIVSAGEVKGPVYDRYTARKAGKTSTGHALPPYWRSVGPFALNLFMAPGDSTVEEMIASTQRGLYITRFWYTRLVHPSDCVITGMTRDGVFLVDDGEIAYPVKNLRFTQSYVQALAEVEAIGQEHRLLVSDYTNIATRVPALKISRFQFTGSTV